jgi:REP element-mobilizing transposase RayT
MTIPRRNQISLGHTPYYHCIARCVRRAFLCGRDRFSGRSFSHRRQWLVDRIRLQTSVFGIGVCAYAIMENHYHVVLRVNRQQVLGWSEHEVIERWTLLFNGPVLVQAYQQGATLTKVERHTLSRIVAEWRRRLYDISWFMRCLNEYIARRANAEDECRGRFWEGRFKSQALLDDSALLSCMAYVDLNPVRAGLATNLIDSDFTSIQERLRELRSSNERYHRRCANSWLLPFSRGQRTVESAEAIRFGCEEYLDLVEQTGRGVRRGKRGNIVGQGGSLLCRMGLSCDQWVTLSLELQARSLRAVGKMAKMRAYAEATGYKWIAGVGRIREIYSLG